jgi:hypothetical protein
LAGIGQEAIPNGWKTPDRLSHVFWEPPPLLPSRSCTSAHRCKVDARPPHSYEPKVPFKRPSPSIQVQAGSGSDIGHCMIEDIERGRWAWLVKASKVSGGADDGPERGTLVKVVPLVTTGSRRELRPPKEVARGPSLHCTYCHFRHAIAEGGTLGCQSAYTASSCGWPVIRGTLVFGS